MTDSDALSWLILHREFTITGPEAFTARVRGALHVIAQTPTGQALFDEIKKTKKTITISQGKERSMANTLPQQHNPDAIPRGHRWESWEDEGTGKGCDTKIELQFSQSLPSKPWFRDCPDGLRLAHELIHAYLYATGNYNPDKIDAPLDGKTHYDVRKGELQVIGLAQFANLPITENRMRREWTPIQQQRLDW